MSNIDTCMWVLAAARVWLSWLRSFFFANEASVFHKKTSLAPIGNLNVVMVSY